MVSSRSQNISLHSIFPLCFPLLGSLCDCVATVPRNKATLVGVNRFLIRPVFVSLSPLSLRSYMTGAIIVDYTTRVHAAVAL